MVRDLEVKAAPLSCLLWQMTHKGKGESGLAEYSIVKVSHRFQASCVLTKTQHLSPAAQWGGQLWAWLRMAVVEAACSVPAQY